jgi:hypothetical protein
MEKIRLRTGEIRERREKKREGSLEDLLGAVHFHLVACYLETSLLAGAGVETSERALRERIVWRERWGFRPSWSPPTCGRGGIP